MSYTDFLTTYGTIALLFTPWLVFGAIMWKLGDHVQPRMEKKVRQLRVKMKTTTRKKKKQPDVDIITDTCPTCGWYELINGQCKSCGSESKK